MPRCVDVSGARELRLVQLVTIWYIHVEVVKPLSRTTVIPRRTLIVGDVHGCLTELDELLRTAAFDARRERLVLTGDLLDRGPESVGVLRRVRELGAISVLGNHEQQHLWRSARASRDLARARPTRAGGAMSLALSIDDLAWLASLPRWLRLDGLWVVVHAGFEPGVAIERQEPEVTQRIRFVDAGGSWAHLDADGNAPPGSRYWASAWDGVERVVYGHHIHGLATPRVDEPRPGVTCIGIDTGCCVGGRLTALILPSLEFVQVQSRRPPTPFRAKD